MARYPVLCLLIVGIALAQAHTVWQYRGINVDESELIHYAVGFFGGDFDPGWYGYGSIGMYLLYVVYGALGVGALGLGLSDSVTAYAEQLFYSGYFVQVARVVFAVVGVVTIAVYAKAALLLRVPRLLVAAFVVVALASRDVLEFANYVRTDKLVSLFVALALLAFITAFREDSTRLVPLYGIGIAVGGAIAAKISALPLVLFLAFALVYARWARGCPLRHVAGAAGAFLFALLLFQPFADYPALVASVFSRGADAPFSWSKPSYGSVVSRLDAIFTILRSYVSLPVVLLSLAILARVRDRIGLAVILLILLFSAPYALSSEVTYYWFAPLFDLVRFAALLGVATVLSLAARQVEVPRGARWPLVGATAAVVTVTALLAAPTVRDHVEEIRYYTRHAESNKELAREWLEDRALGRTPILIDSSFGHVLPSVYDPSDLEQSRRISRAFIFNRNENTFLSNAFASYVRGPYAREHGIAYAVDAERDRDLVNRTDSLSVAGISDAYFVTSPAIYERFLERQPAQLTSEHAEQLELFRRFYADVLPRPLVARFSSGLGPPIEVYAIAG